MVAGPGIEPGSQGYEPCEIPLLYPAISVQNEVNKPRTREYTILYPQSNLKYNQILEKPLRKVESSF